MIRCHFSGADAACGALAEALDEETERAAEIGARVVAEVAARNHDYQNRTGDLEGSTGDVPPTGRFTDDSLQFGAAAGAEYGEFVDAKLPFLEPAYEASEARLEHEFDNALGRAATIAGWT